MTKLVRGKGQNPPARGFVFLLIMLTILAIAGIVFLNSTAQNALSTQNQLRRDQLSTGLLIAAKNALLGRLMSPANNTLRPGILPAPDSLANGTYDGKSDTQCLGNSLNGLPGVGANSLVKRCIGKVPWLTLSLDLANPAVEDPLGQVPWMAISANLAPDEVTCLPVFNSDVANLTSPVTPSCAGVPGVQPTALPHPWLKVFDEAGNLLSDKVAIVLILPGAPIQTETRSQNRTPSSPGNPSDYLDSINLPLGCLVGCTLFDNANLTNQFVMIKPGTRYPSDAPNVAKRGAAVPFNDTLIYLTIDEVMPYAERRVVGQMALALRDLKANSSFSAHPYPWLASTNTLPTATTSLVPQAGIYYGHFPFMTDSAAGANSDYATDFDWSITGLIDGTLPTCVRINSAPNVYIKPTLLNSLTPPLATPNLANGAATSNVGQCRWKGIGNVSCALQAGKNITTNFPVTMTTYSNNTCTTATGATTLSIARAITALQIDATCRTAPPVAPVISYVSASASDVHRWKWACGIVANTSAASIDVTDTISNIATSWNRLPLSTSTSSLGTPTQITVDRMMYHPIMPAWFHENLWYQTAFAAVAPSAAAANTSPCGSGINFLTTGGVTKVEAITAVAGKNLTTNIRPSSLITDYFEGNNALGKGGVMPGISNCAFDTATSLSTVTANDQLQVVSP